MARVGKGYPLRYNHLPCAFQQIHAKMKRTLKIIALLQLCLQAAPIFAQPTPDKMEWFRYAKLGIFIYLSIQ